MKNFTEIFSWVYAAMHAWSGASYKGRVVDKHFIEWHLIAFFPPAHTYPPLPPDLILHLMSCKIWPRRYLLQAAQTSENNCDR